MKLKNILLGAFISLSIVPVTVNAQTYQNCKKDSNGNCVTSNASSGSSGGWFPWFLFGRSSNTGITSHRLSTSTPVDENFGHSASYSASHAMGEHAGFGGHAAAHGGEGGE